MKRISVLIYIVFFFSCGQVEPEKDSSQSSVVSASEPVPQVAELSPTQQRVNQILQNKNPNTAYTPYQEQRRTDNSPIPSEIEERLIQQGTEMFALIQEYDLETLDEFAPRMEEMADYYKVFNANAFQIKWNFFQKNYQTDGINFGDNLEYDHFLIERITSRAAVLRAKSLSLTKERVQIADQVEINKVYIKPSPRHNDMYDIHVRFKKKDLNEYYEIVNEACWLTDRGCIYTQSWKFLGKYLPLLDKYQDSQLNIRDGASFAK